MTENLQPQAEVVAEEVQDAPKIPETKRYKVKVDGIESEVDENELVNSYQKGRSADKKFQEAADLRKQLEAFVDNVRANPNQLLEQLGHDPKEWAKQLLLKEIEQEEQESDPNLKRIANLEKKLTDLEGAEKAKKASEAELNAKAEESALVSRIDDEIGKTLEDMGFITGSAPAELIADIAEQMLAEYKFSKTSLNAKEALSRTKDSYSKRLTAISKVKPDAILELIPSEYLDKIAEAYISKRKSKEVPSLKSFVPAAPESKEKEIQKQLEDFFKRKS